MEKNIGFNPTGLVGTLTMNLGFQDSFIVAAV